MSYKTFIKHAIKNPKYRLWIPPVAGFLCYGTWAFWVNSGFWGSGVWHWPQAIKAAITQGTYSFMITLSLAILVEWLFVTLKTIPMRSLWVWLIAVVLLAFTSTAINILAGTPEVFWTVLPGFLVSSAYSLIYVLTLKRLAL